MTRRLLCCRRRRQLPRPQWHCSPRQPRPRFCSRFRPSPRLPARRVLLYRCQPRLHLWTWAMVHPVSRGGLYLAC